MIRKLLDTVSAQRDEDKKAELYRNLIRYEAKIGGQLFGPVPNGGKREFFCLDRHSWVWHEEWIDKQGQKQSKTTRYDIRPSGVLKAQNGQTYQVVGATEAKRLYQAAKLYQDRVKNEAYSFVN